MILQTCSLYSAVLYLYTIEVVHAYLYLYPYSKLSFHNSFWNNFMVQHDSVGPKAGFSYFVFKQLYEKHQYAKLLRLGEDFQEELAIFLKEHKDLLWLHEIFLNHFSAASETLHALALSNDDGSNLVTDDGPDSQDIKKMPSLADRRRLLNLSKIATVAGLLFYFID